MNGFAGRSLSIATGAARMNCRLWPALWRYAMAILVVAIVTILKAILPLGCAPFLLYMPGVVVIAFVLGRGPGYAAILLTAAIAILFFMSPAGQAGLSWDELFSTVLYMLISAALVTISNLLALALRRRESELAETLDAKQALEHSESFLRSIMASSTDCIKLLDVAGHVNFMNEGGLKVMEIDDFQKIKDCPWPDLWQGEGQVEARQAIAEAQAGRASRFQGFCKTMNGTAKWWDVSVAPIWHAGDGVEWILVTSRDITEQKRSEGQQRLLNHELGHRLKNMLAMIQAVANQTLRRATSLADASAAFDSRLIALGKAQDVLTDTQWKSADITAVINNSLAAHGGKSGPFTVAGPPLTLSSRCALALSLALHELATNAAKYGALSAETGHIAIDWGVHQEESGLRFHLEWRESGGPMVKVPERTGFGSFMIERSLSAYFRGSARIEYIADGVVFTLDAPATSVEAEFLSGETDILTQKVNII